MLEVLRRAIHDREVVSLSYEPGARLIEPHCLGRSAEGFVLLRAYQTSGASASHESIDWKLFRLDRMSYVTALDEGFVGPRPGYRRGDQAMKHGIIAQL